MFDPSNPQDSYNRFGFESLCNLPETVAKSAFIDNLYNNSSSIIFPYPWR